MNSITVLLLAAAAAVPIVMARTPTSRDGWKQPPIVTGCAEVEALPWAKTIEEALERAKKEKKLVLATVVAVSDDHWVSGYAGAEQHWSKLEAPAFGDDVAMAVDEGLRKECVLMAVWFADPGVASLVKQHFVPVRVRCRPWDFDLDFPKDPIAPLGTKLDDVGAPALVIAKPDGSCVHSLGRIGVFSAVQARLALEGALARSAGKKPTSPAPNASEPRVPKAAADFAAKRGVRLEEWTRPFVAPTDPLARTTERDASRDTIDSILDRGASVLLALQGEAGGFASPAVDPRAIGGAGTMFDLMVPRTALVVDALLSLRARLPKRARELESAARRGIDLVGRFADAPQPWIWHATYALHLQVVLLRSDLGDEHAKARARAGRLVMTLVELQQDGGWTYMRSPRVHSFNTAPVLLLFADLADVGVEVPEESIAAAQKFLASLRNPADPSDYFYAPTMKFDEGRAADQRPASCRAAACELALLESGDAGAARRLGRAVDLFFEGEAAVRATTKIYESFFSPKSLHDAYHYFFGHYYAARALAKLPKEKGAKLAKQQLAILRKQVEIDGSFVDAQAQGKSYSTAMALLTILEDLRCAGQ